MYFAVSLVHLGQHTNAEQAFNEALSLAPYVLTFLLKDIYLTFDKLIFFLIAFYHIFKIYFKIQLVKKLFLVTAFLVFYIEYLSLLYVNCLNTENSLIIRVMICYSFIIITCKI